MSKKREGKGINISPTIHKMLKLQSTLVGDNMIDLVEKAILDSMPDDIKKIVYQSENINTSEFEQKDKVKNIDENEKKESNEKEEPLEQSNEKEEPSEQELSCYM
ncbi:MAG: hypothetical protein E6342_17950 [Clostridium sp.]|uniref:hypothetical protein n=1 Tax=Clostridium sp. TaxID=1506 RepID=UPI00290D5D4C|nr:hypothetical protein [Clostridium sp.]MDU4844009.1 hypothetical protein [Leclercia adecarboxylata]MDU7089571.1 hypothetical protein [Clostridium sp.]